MAVLPHVSSRSGARRLGVAFLVIAVLAVGVSWLYSPAGHRSTAAVEPLPPPEPVETPFQQKSRTFSPAADLTAAQNESNPERRASQTRAALQAWARLNPDAAAEWVLAQPPQHRLVNASVVLIALADRPDEALRIGRVFCKEDPANLREHGNSLVAVLTAAGEFERAVTFASLGGPERNEWVSRTFAGWTELAPGAAARAALASESDDAISVVFTTWATRNHNTAARYTTGTADPVAAQRNAVIALAGGTSDR